MGEVLAIVGLAIQLAPWISQGIGQLRPIFSARKRREMREDFAQFEDMHTKIEGLLHILGDQVQAQFSRGMRKVKKAIHWLGRLVRRNSGHGRWARFKGIVRESIFYVLGRNRLKATCEEMGRILEGLMRQESQRLEHEENQELAVLYRKLNDVRRMWRRPCKFGRLFESLLLPSPHRTESAGTETPEDSSRQRSHVNTDSSTFDSLGSVVNLISPQTSLDPGTRRSEGTHTSVARSRGTQTHTCPGNTGTTATEDASTGNGTTATVRTDTATLDDEGAAAPVATGTEPLEAEAPGVPDESMAQSWGEEQDTLSEMTDTPTLENITESGTSITADTGNGISSPLPSLGRILDNERFGGGTTPGPEDGAVPSLGPSACLHPKAEVFGCSNMSLVFFCSGPMSFRCRVCHLRWSATKRSSLMTVEDSRPVLKWEYISKSFWVMG